MRQIWGNRDNPETFTNQIYLAKDGDTLIVQIKGVKPARLPKR